jgi:multidrug efflux pump subunit AcrA (membrane-fusion protein)
VVRTASSIDASTRTMQAEVNLPNRDGALLPGAFVQVELAAAASGALTIPSNALLFRGQGTLVAKLDAAGTVQLQPVRLGRNYGEFVEVEQGLQGNETLILNPPDSLANGDKVRIAADNRSAAPASGKGTL